MQEQIENKPNATTIFITDECFKKAEIVLNHSEIRCNLKFDSDDASKKFFNYLIKEIKGK